MRHLRILALLAVLLAPWPASAEQPLAPVSTKLRQQFPAVGQITAAELAERLGARPNDLLIFDVRTPEEFAVSRIPGARRVDPGVGARAFLSAAGDVSGKSLVFYCSVGYRSSKLATAVMKPLEANGAREVVNLTGGVFGWHNDGRPLVADAGPTRLVHPYSSSWAPYLKHADLLSTVPEVAGQAKVQD